VVGLIADTHGLVRPEVATVFHGVDRIVHAGDVGGARVLEALSHIAPVDAVYGNVDDPADPMLAARRAIRIGELTLHVTHGHELGRPSPAVVLAAYPGDVLVFGHTHRAIVFSEGAKKGSGGVFELAPAGSGASRIVINPGAAGPRRFDLRPSVARLTIYGTRAKVEIISLA